MMKEMEVNDENKGWIKIEIDQKNKKNKAGNDKWN